LPAITGEAQNFVAGDFHCSGRRFHSIAVRVDAQVLTIRLIY
jgi:hypothetical protein